MFYKCLSISGRVYKRPLLASMFWVMLTDLREHTEQITSVVVWYKANATYIKKGQERE